MEDASNSPWWFDDLGRITLARSCVDTVIDNLEDYTGHIVTDRHAYAQALEEAATCYFETLEAQQPPLADVRDEYRALVRELDGIRDRIDRIASSEALSRPLQRAAFYGDISLVEARETLANDIGVGYDSGHLGAKLAYRWFHDFHQLCRSALDTATWEAGRYAGHGADLKEAREGLAVDLAYLYEAVTGVGAPRTDDGPFVCHYKDVWRILEPGDPPSGRTILRYLEDSRRNAGRMLIEIARPSTLNAIEAPK